MNVLRLMIGFGVHLLLFVGALFIFLLGLGVGLALNPALGTLLWIAAFTVAGINIFWMMRKPLWR